MIHPERAKLVPVTGNNDNPDLPNAVDVQFNPSTLKVSLSNTLKENKRNGNSRSAQFVDKSSSSLTVELIFDTTYIDASADEVYRTRASEEGRSREAIEAGSDVRLVTKRIADAFIKPVSSGNKLKAPSRCLFQWGAFEFLGMIQSFQETLDFFSPKGRPLRATIALQLTEDRYQFRNAQAAAEEQRTPTLTSTGNTENDDPNQNTSPVPGDSGNGPGNWRDTALFNGIESPRLPSASILAVPKISASASIGVSGGIGASVSARVGIQGSISASASATAGVGGSVKASINVTPPAFKFGASTSLGTGIEGAFSPTGASPNLSAGSLISGGAQLRGGGKASSSPSTSSSLVKLKPKLSAKASASAQGSVGFD